MSNKIPWLRIVTRLLIAAGVILLLYYLRSIVLYLLISALVTLIGRPLFNQFLRIRIGRIRINKSFAALFTLLVFYLVFFVFFSLFIPLIVEEIEIISSVNPEKFINALKVPLASYGEFLENLDMDVDPEKSIKKFVAGFFDDTFHNSVFDSVLSVLSGIGNVAVTFFSVSFIAFFFLQDESIIPLSIYALTPNEHLEAVKRVVESTKLLLRRYFIGLIIQVTIVTLTIFIILSILGIKNALLIGFFAGTINIIPYLGPVFGYAFALFVVFSTNLDYDFISYTLPLQLQAVAAMICVQLFDNIVLQPMIYSSSVKAHPLEIFLIILIAAQVAGVVGMIAAVPVYTVMRILAKEFLSHSRVIQKLTENM